MGNSGGAQTPRQPKTKKTPQVLNPDPPLELTALRVVVPNTYPEMVFTLADIEARLANIHDALAAERSQWVDHQPWPMDNGWKICTYAILQHAIKTFGGTTLTEDERHGTLALLFDRPEYPIGVLQTIYMLTGSEARVLRNWTYGHGEITDFKTAPHDILTEAAIFWCYYHAYWWLAEQEVLNG